MVTLASNNRDINADSKHSGIEQLRLDISSKLHSSLDIDDVLSHFFNCLNTLMHCDGLNYKDESQNLHIAIGQSKAHHANYKLCKNDENLGTLSFSRQHRFAEAELTTIETLIGLLIYPLRNARLYRSALESSHVDTLTGLRNRRALLNCIHREIPLAQRHNKELSVLVLDIDNFKLINDREGHLCGDLCLEHIAQLLKASLRAGDQAFRYGGEEFVILLSECDATNAYYCAERIRSQIASNPADDRGRNIHLTVSIGSATLRSDDDFNTLFERADQAMYSAKKHGRNRCEKEPAPAKSRRKKIA